MIVVKVFVALLIGFVSPPFLQAEPLSSCVDGEKEVVDDPAWYEYQCPATQQTKNTNKILAIFIVFVVYVKKRHGIEKKMN